MIVNWNISAVRMFAMCCIVVCHIFQFYKNDLMSWFNLGVEVFFVISGYLYGDRQINHPGKFIYKNWLKILLPCELFLVVAVLCYYMVGYGFKSWYDGVACFTLIKNPLGLGHLWFVNQILICYALIPLLAYIRDKISRRGKCKYIFVVFFIMLGCVGMSRVSNTFVRFNCLVVFMAGYYFRDFNKRFGDNVPYLEYFIVFLGSCAFLLSAFVSVPTFLDIYLRGLIGIGFFVAILKFGRFGASSILKTADKYSYSIYLVHHIFILGPLSLLSNNIMEGFAVIKICVALVVILSASVMFNYFSSLVLRSIR